MIGDPVAHSLSPAMHNAAIAALGLDAAFLALRASPATFEAVVRGILAAGGSANITVPHKRAAARLLDLPSDPVRRTGACNAIWTEAGSIAGDNTDVSGVRDEVRRLMEPDRVRRAVVVGTGGSARAVVVAIAEGWSGAELAVVSRDVERAAEFAKWAGEAGITCRVWGVGESERVDLVVNATPLGLKPDDPLPIDSVTLERVAPAALLDLVYARGETKLVRAAKKQGVRAADGRGVLVAQGAAAFHHFFGVEAPQEVMRTAVDDALRA